MKSQDDPLLNWKRPNIVIRKRTLHETRDLAVRIVCQKFKPLILYYSIVALPVLAFDYLLWFLIFGRWFRSAETGGLEFVLNYGGSLISLSVIWLTITLETGLMGSLATEYLGIWLFAGDEKIPFRRVFRGWWERKGQLFYYLFLKRIIDTRAFYPETILLERHPFRGKNRQLSTSRRVKNINAGGVGTEASFAFLFTEFYVASGIVAGWSLLYSGVASIVDEPALTIFIAVLALYPPFIAACRLFNVVYNFCYYINYRISREGWDVDLAFKTELTKWIDDGSDFDEFGASDRTRRLSKTLAPLSLEPELNVAAVSTEATDEVCPAREDKEASHEI